jgi:homoserine kinase
MSLGVRVRVPATTANLGPGFDSLGLALNLWNNAEFSLEGSSYRVCIMGEGENCLPESDHNLIVRAARSFYQAAGIQEPAGLKITCENRIPLGSGLGSSAAAVLLGILGAAAISNVPLSLADTLHLAWKLEGHPDNSAAALYGGIVVAVVNEKECLVRRFDLPTLHATIAVPEINLPTSASRKALPPRVPFRDAVFNLGRTALVVEALRTGDLELLSKVTDDRLHQPYRLKLIPGADAAMQAARSAGAQAVALSGAGPSLIAFSGGTSQAVGVAMQAAFERSNVASRVFHLETTSLGAAVEKD